MIYNNSYALRGAHFRPRGFAATLGDTGVDVNTVTSVNILFNRALSIKLYVITIIIGMCTTFPTDPSRRVS